MLFYVLYPHHTEVVFLSHLSSTTWKNYYSDSNNNTKIIIIIVINNIILYLDVSISAAMKNWDGRSLFS